MINELFEANQKDLGLDDVRVQWMGSKVRLWTSEVRGGAKRLVEKDITVGMLSTANVVEKIKRFCVKTNRRCSQIQNGKVIL